MLFRKSLRRDLTNLAGVVFATLFTIMVTTTLVRLLGRASAGRVDTATVLPLIAFSSINYLPVLLVLTLYVSVLSAMTRAWRDSEMVVWFASGQGLSAWIRPVLSFALPFAVAVGLIAMFVSPWANRQAAEYTQRFAQREDVSQVSAGQFRESARSERVFFVESLSPDAQSVRNVFVAQRRGESDWSVVVSSGGFIETAPEGGRYLVLERGRRYDGSTLDARLRLTEFERYGVRLDPRPLSGTDYSVRARDTAELIADPQPRYLGELAWRLGLPVSALLLALLAIPLSAVNPRVGRSVNLVIALLVYVLYTNLQSLVQAWIAQGRVPFAVGVWLVHALLAAACGFLFWRRVSARRLLPRWPGRRRRGAADGASAPAATGA